MSERDDQKLQVQQATDIVQLIGEDVALKSRGREFVCLCPFHDDSNPSLNVVPHKQIYHCFVCGAGGDVFSWVMNYHKMAFPQALELLAERAGIQLKSFRRDEDAGSTDERQTMLDANDKAARFFQRLLVHPEHGRAAREYLDRRGVSAEMIERFQIGYASDRWDGLIAMIADKAWHLPAFEQAGLIVQREGQDGRYDWLRHRLVFPIADALGRPVAFGGRRLREEDNPKYINTRETLLFNKSATLFGLHLAKQAIIAQRSAVIVEGYTDVVACHQAGVANVVATLGTALTTQHVGALRHYADKVVLIFDGDEAGQKAADRAVEVFLTGALDVAIAILPEGMDPADLLSQEDGVQRWNDAIEQARDALDYQFDRIRQRIKAADTVTARETVIREYLQSLATLGLQRMPALRRAFVLQRLAQLLRIGEPQIDAMLRQLAPRTRTPDKPLPDDVDNQDNLLADVADRPSEARIVALEAAEKNLIGCLLREPGRFHQILNDGRSLDETITPDLFRTDKGRRVFQALRELLEQDEQLTIGGFLAELAAQEALDLTALVVDAYQQVEDATAGESERIEPMLVAAAEAVLNHEREAEYQSVKRERVVASPEQQDQMLRRIDEHLRHRSGGRTNGRE